MGQHDADQIVGIRDLTTGNIKCRDCMDSEDWDNMSEDQIVEMSEIENPELVFFCDECKKRM